MSGVISRGVRAPIIREGDDIVKLTADAVEAAMAEEGFELHARDIVAVTESVVARADGNYASVDDSAADVPSPSFSPSFPGTASPSACAASPAAAKRSC